MAIYEVLREKQWGDLSVAASEEQTFLTACFSVTLDTDGRDRTSSREDWKIKERQTKPCFGFVGMGNINIEEDGKDQSSCRCQILFTSECLFLPLVI